MSIQVHCQILSRYEIAQICLAVFRTVHFDGSFIASSTILFQKVKKLFIWFALSTCQVHFVEVETFAQFFYWWKGGIFGWTIVWPWSLVGSFQNQTSQHAITSEEFIWNNLVDTSCERSWEVSFVQVSSWDIYCVFGIVSHALLHFSWGGQAIQVHCQFFSRYKVAQISLAIFGTVHFYGSFIALCAVLFQEI